MNNELLITLEILLVVVLPLLFLYLKSNWLLRDIIPCLLVVPVLWYLTYALLHELAHVAGAYLAGGTIVEYKLIPRFWLGEFGRAWVKPDGLAHTWQQLVCTTFPYFLNVVCIVVGISVLRRGISVNPFVVGLIFMLLCLRTAFDFVSELTGLLSGDRGDYDAIRSMIGTNLTWLFIFFSLGLSLVSVVLILRRFVGFPEPEHTQPIAP
jgi:hypothetical protein